MIALQPVPAGDLARLADLRMSAGPPYASDGAVAILDRTPGLTFHEILADGRRIGMVKLDPRYHERHDFAAVNDIGVRGVLIDRDHQGQGHGVAAMAALSPYAAGLFPQATSLVLTVNTDNTRAYRTYLRAGFHDTGALYTGGTLGPQHILRCPLPRT